MTNCKTVYIQTPLGLADELRDARHKLRVVTEALSTLVRRMERDNVQGIPLDPAKAALQVARTTTLSEEGK